MRTDKLNILVAVPSTTMLHARTALCLTSMVMSFSNYRPTGVKSSEIRIQNMRGSILPNLRLDALKTAKNIDASHILFIDSDHTFPAGLLMALLKHDKDCVAINCVTKQIPAQPTARAFSGTDNNGVPVYSDPDKHGLERVWRVGTGIMLLSKRAYMQLPHSCFEMRYREERDTYQGEDWLMAEILESVGCPIYIDHDLSRHVGHLGEFEYTHDIVGTKINLPAE